MKKIQSAKRALTLVGFLITIVTVTIIFVLVITFGVPTYKNYFGHSDAEVLVAQENGGMTRIAATERDGDFDPPIYTVHYRLNDEPKGSAHTARVQDGVIIEIDGVPTVEEVGPESAK